MTNRLYVANLQSSSVSINDGEKNAVTATATVGQFPYALAVNETTNRIYVVNYGGSSVSVIDGTSNNVVATVAVEPYSKSVTVNAATNRIYVTNLDNISVIDGASNTVVVKVPISLADAVAVSVTTNRLYVSGHFITAPFQGALPYVSSTPPTTPLSGRYRSGLNRRVSP